MANYVTQLVVVLTGCGMIRKSHAVRPEPQIKLRGNMLSCHPLALGKTYHPEW